MIQFRYLLLLFIIGMTAGGCSRPKVTLEFSLPTELHMAYTINYYNVTPRGGRYIETGVMIQQGKAKTILPLADEAVISVAAAGKTIYIYAERGDKISLTGESADMFSWKIGGNKINDQWTRWRNDNDDILQSSDSWKVNKAVEEYVKKNPDNPLSALLLLYNYNRRENNDGFLKLWAMLKGEAAKEKWITLSGRSDLYSGRPLTPLDTKKSHTFVLKTLANGADTIRTGKTPVTILFWRSNDQKRTEMVDSLRSLRKSHPDSAKYLIVDVCFDPDSINWAMPLIRDSLKGVVRAWMPLGETDSIARLLGVERTPMIIHIDTIVKEVKKK